MKDGLLQEINQDIVNDYYYSTISDSVRKSALLTDIESTSSEDISGLCADIYNKISGTSGFGYPVAGYMLLKLATTPSTSEYPDIAPSSKVQTAICTAFATYIINNYNGV